jgi:hypothetical protein
MVGHDHKRTELVMAKLGSSQQGVDYQGGNGLLPEIRGSRLGPIKVTIHPDECLSG